MYLMFGDEADKEQTAGKKFFVYGAVFVPTNSMASLHAEIEKARKEAGLVNTDSLKSSSNSRPEGFPPEKHRVLKNTVMKLAREVGNVKFCAQVTLHELARNQEQKDLVLFGANTILGKFNTFLSDNRTQGYVLLDRVPVGDPYSYLKEKFQVGMTFPDGKIVRLERILGLGHGCDGSSHLCSVADVLLGAFRYCVNDPENEEAAKAMFPTIMSMMWTRTRDGKPSVMEAGLVLRPQVIKEEKHKAEYNALTDRLRGYLA
jgi:hypothetical protein